MSNNTFVTRSTYNTVKAVAGNFKNGSAFVASLQITDNFDLAVGVNVVLAQLAKEAFDAAYDVFKKAGRDVMTVGFKTRSGKTVEIKIDFANSVVVRKGVEYTCREFVVLNFKGNKDAEGLASGVYPVDAALFLLSKVVPACKTETSLDRVLDLMTSRVLVDPSVQQVLNGGEYYGKKSSVEGVVNQQWVMELHKISALGVHIHVTDDKAFAGLRACKLAPSKSGLSSNTFAVVAEVFAKFGEPVFCDKNNAKYLYFGDACRAAGADLVDGRFVTFNPLEVKDGAIAKPAKVFNRLASHNFLSAVVAGEMRSNLRLGLSGDKYTVSAGLPMQTLVAFSHFNNGSGVALTNGYDFHFSVPKTLVKEVNVDRFDAAFRASLGNTSAEVLEGICNHVKAGVEAELSGSPVLGNGAAVEVDGVEVVRNPRFFPVSVTAVEVTPGSRTFNDSVRTVRVKVTGFASMSKKNPKLRSMTKKLTAMSKPGTIVSVVEGGKAVRFDGWEIILNPECIKGSSAVLEIFANEHINKVVEWRAGVLSVDGVEVTQEDLMAWIESRKQEFVIEQPVSASYVEEYKEYKGNFEFVNKGEDSWVLRERCFGLVGIANYQVEVSTADENYGVSKLGVAEQYILSNVNAKVDAKLRELCAKELGDADLLSGAPTRVFKLASSADRKALVEFLTVNNEVRSKSYIGALASKELHGIRIELELNGYTWVANIPFGVLLRFGAWDECGKALSSYLPATWSDEAEEGAVSTNILEDCFDLIEAIGNKSLRGADLKDYFIHWGGFFGAWLNSIRTGKTMAGMVKAGNTWHVKVLTDSNVGEYSRVGKTGVIETGVPSLVVDAKSPLLAVNSAPSADAGLRDGDVVFIHRNPLPLFTACVVKVDNSGKYDAGMAVVNPVVWTKATVGDADGDLIYIVPAKKFGVSGYKLAREYNKRATAQGGHWNVFEMGSGESPVEDFVNAKDGVIGAAKSDADLVKAWTLVNNSVTVKELTTVAEGVHKHYKVAVGKLYNYAFELTRYLSEASTASDADLVAMVKGWITYEEVGLGGYTVANANTVEDLKDEAEKFAHITVRRVQPVSSTAAAKFRALMNKGGGSAASNSQLVEAAARVELAKKVVKGKVLAPNSEILACAAVRNLTRKTFGAFEAEIYNLVKGKEIGGRFGAQVETITALRSKSSK